MSENLDITAELSGHPFMKGFPEETIARMTDCVDGVVTWPEDEIVFRSGGEATKCYLVQTGEVAIEVHSPGAGSRIVQTVAHGEVLGWSWLFEPYVWSFDARVLTPAKAIVLNSDAIRHCMSDVPELGYPLMTRFARLIVGRLQATRLQLLDLYANRN